MHEVIWSIYFNQMKAISLRQNEAIFLMRLLYGEVSDQNVDAWLAKHFVVNPNLLENPRTEY